MAAALGQPEARLDKGTYRAAVAQAELLACAGYAPGFRGSTNVPHQRLMPPLQRYAVAGWTARELHAHLDRLIASRGWTVPGRPAELIERDSGGQVRVRVRTATTMKSPCGYLAFLLRQIDPTDLATDQAYDAALRATEHYQRQLIYGSPCPHGQPAGDIPSPTKGIRACPLCRRQASSDAIGADRRQSRT